MSARGEIFFYALGAGLAGVGTLLAVPLVIRAGGAEVFGIWGLLEAGIAIGTPLALAGSHLGLIKQISYERIPIFIALGKIVWSVQPVVGAVAVLAGFVGALFGFSSWIAISFSAVIYGEALLLLAMSALRGAGTAAYFALAQGAKAIMFVLLILAASLFAPHVIRDSVLGLIVIRLIAVVAALVLAYGGTSRAARAAGSPVDHHEQTAGGLRDALIYGAPIYAASLSQMAIDFADRFFIANYLGASLTGQYVAHAKLVNAVSMGLIGPFSLWWAGERYRCMRDGARGRERIVNVALVWLAMLLCAACGLVVLSPFVFRAFAPGLTFDPLVLGLLLFSTIFVGMTYVLNNAALLPGRTSWNALAGLLAAAANLLLCALLIPGFGGRGAAIATLLANVMLLILLAAHSQRHFPLPMKWSRMVGAVLLAVLVSVVFGRWATTLA